MSKLFKLRMPSAVQETDILCVNLAAQYIGVDVTILKEWQYTEDVDLQSYQNSSNEHLYRVSALDEFLLTYERDWTFTSKDKS